MTKSAKADVQTPGGRSAGVGGKRLSEAFEVAARAPVLAESQRRLAALIDAENASPNDVADAIECDAALAIAVMRAANNGDGPAGRAGGVREAVDSLGPREVVEIAASQQAYDPFEPNGFSPVVHDRFRRHAVATRHAADRVAEAAGMGQRDELAVAALLHDVGRLVLVELYGREYGFGPASESPDERIRNERRALGIDHALVGSVLVRRWGLKPAIAAAIERHHSPDAEGHAAAIRLADAIVHHAAGEPLPVESITAAAAQVGLGPEQVRAMVYEFPHAGTQRRRSSDPNPLSDREIDALRGLAEGKVYKQIAAELGLSVSTIRTHLHNVYRKIGAVDRAQAVLIARDRGWI